MVVSSIQVICFWCFAGLVHSTTYLQNSHELYLKETLDLIFPNRSSNKALSGRELETKSVACVQCTSMSVCKALKSYLIEEVYYPNNLVYKETCKVLDELGFRTQSVIFGNGRTFRDTELCRGLDIETYFGELKLIFCTQIS